VAEPGYFCPARRFANCQHSLAVDVLDIRASQRSAVFVEEAGGCLEEFQPPLEYLVLVFDVGKSGQEGKDHHKPPQVADISA